MIIDASVAVPWFIDTPASSRARQVRPKRAIGPTLLLTETANVLLRYQRVKSFETARIHDIVLRIEKLFHEIVPDHSLLSAAIDIASSQNHKIYDCLYLALALERGEPLATADRRMAEIARALSIETELIEPSL
jgi:predicted nucleic acid-binding protein